MVLSCILVSTDHTKLEPKRPVSEACQILFGKVQLLTVLYTPFNLFNRSLTIK